MLLPPMSILGLGGSWVRYDEGKTSLLLPPALNVECTGLTLRRGVRLMRSTYPVVGNVKMTSPVI